MASKSLTKKEQSVVDAFHAYNKRLEKELVEYFFNEHVNKLDVHSELNNNYKCTKFEHESTVMNSTYVGGEREIKIEMKYGTSIILFDFEKSWNDGDEDEEDINISINSQHVYNYHESIDSDELISDNDNKNKIYTDEEVTALVKFFEKIQLIF